MRKLVNIDVEGLEIIPEPERQNIKKVIFRILEAADLNDYSMSIGLVDAPSMIELNHRFRNKKKVTDVLSFPVPEEERHFEHSKFLLGDLIICVPQALSQAQEFGHSLDEEIAVLCAHGLFHLLGYDHEVSKEEADIQMQGEMYLLEVAGFSPELCLIGRA